MSLDSSRIESIIDVQRMATATVAIVGLGGAAKLACDLARCGARRFVLVDFDHVEPSNVARQDHMADHVGWRKVDAVAHELRRIDPEVETRPVTANFCELSDAEIEEHFAGVDLLIMATDSFPAQARGNAVALQHRIPVIMIGLYEGAQAGEVFFWHQDLDCCFRCMTPGRYAAYKSGNVPPVTSRGASIFDIRLPDTIAGMIAVGLLTRGADNRYGRLIDQLGDRQFLQIKIDPTYLWNGRDIFREQLGIAADCETYFSFVTIARSDPDRGQLPCPDCERYRGHWFLPSDLGWERLKPPHP